MEKQIASLHGLDEDRAMSALTARSNMRMKKIQVQVRATRDDDPGQVAGAYTIENDVHTMVGRDGVPVRRDTTGEPFVHTLRDGDNPVAIAGQLTLEIRQMMRGENSAEAVKRFGRQLDYPKSGWA